MKKYFLSIVALAAMLFATSCQESLVEPQMEGPTTFTVQLPDGMGTKASFGGYELINRVYVEVHSADGAQLIYKPEGFVAFDASKNSATVTLNLIQDQAYDIVFWAQNGEAYNVSNLKAIQMNNLHHNSQSGAAFFAKLDNFVPNGTSNEVKLRRPFAQLNLGTTAASLETNAGRVNLSTAAITVGNVATTFNALTGYGEGEQTITFEAKSVPTTQPLTVNTTEYKYISMDYLPIAGDAQAVVTVNATIVTDKGIVEHSFTNVPVKENYRTNIVGNLISSTSEFEVTVDAGWDGEDYNHTYAPVVEEVSTADEFIKAIENSEVGEIILTENIELSGSLTFGAPATKAAQTLAGRDFVLDGNGKTIKVNKNDTGRVIDFTDATDGANLTLKNLTIENNVSRIERIINYNTNGVLTLDNVKIVNAEGCSNSYAINLPSSSDNAIVIINNSEIWAGAIALNLWGESTNVTINNSKLYVVDSNSKEGYAVVSLNNGGENAAHNSIINVEGGEVKVIYAGEGETNPSSAFRDATVGSTINISENTVVVGEIKIPVANVIYEGYDQFYSFTTVQAAIDKVQEDKNGTVCLIKDLVIKEKINVKASEYNVVLNLNGYNMHMEDNTEAGFEMINNAGKLTIIGEGKLSVKATINSGWNRRSAVVSNVPGGNLTVEEGVVIEHLGGTDMAYGIDNLTNGKGTYAVTTINGATIKSTYSAIRQFLNGIEATNELYVKKGSTLISPNRSIFFQDPSANANTGKLVVDSGASVTGDVRLSVTEGSTEWPVEVSVVESALTENSNVTWNYIPTGYEVVCENGVWIVKWSPKSENFAENTWEDIIKACQNNVVPESWNVGDIKTMKIGDYTYDIAIIGKNHDDYTAGGKAPLTFQLIQLYGTDARMNETEENTTGWSGSEMRNTTMGEILSAMPAEVRNAIKAVNKVSLNGAKSALETTSDKLFLLSEKEVNGSEYYSGGYVEGARYAYYTDANSQIMKPSPNKDNKWTVSWYLRTPKNDKGDQTNGWNTRFVGINGSGYMTHLQAHLECGVVFGFCF